MQCSRKTNAEEHIRLVFGASPQANHAESGTIMQNEAQSCRISYNHAESGTIMQNQLLSCRTRYNHAESGTIMQNQVQSCRIRYNYIMQSHDK